MINQWIGVQSGYLGDFTYRTHQDFYPVYCAIDDIDPSEMSGTTRERFERILLGQPENRQAAILRGVLERFPPGSEPSASEAHRGSANEAWMFSLIEKVEAGLQASRAAVLTADAAVDSPDSGTSPRPTLSPTSETVARTSSRAIRIESIRVVERLAQEIADSSSDGAEVVVAEMILDAMDVLREYVGDPSSSERVEAWLHLLSRAASFLSGQFGQLAELGLAIRGVVDKYR